MVNVSDVGQQATTAIPNPAADALSSTKPVINQIGGAAPSAAAEVSPFGASVNSGFPAASGTSVTPPSALQATGVGAQPASSGLIGSAQAAGNGLLEFAKQNPTAAFLAGNTAVSAIGGAADARASEEAAAKARQQELDDRQFLNDSINGYNLNYDYSNVQSPYGNQPITPGAFQSPPQMVYDPASQQYVPAQRPQQPQQPRQGLIANNMQRMA